MRNHKVSVTELRSFGLIFSGIVAVLFGIVLPLIFGRGWPYWPWYVAGTVGGLALVAPPLLYPFYKLWMAFGAVMGWINTRLILGLLFFVVMLPIGLLMKLVAKDPMRRRLERDASTYRTNRTPAQREQMEKPY